MHCVVLMRATRTTVLAVRPSLMDSADGSDGPGPGKLPPGDFGWFIGTCNRKGGSHEYEIK